MSEWKTVRLGDVCEILDSKRVPITAHERKNGSYPYYGANGIQDYVADYIFDDELVLLAEDGGNFGSKEKPIAYRVSGKCWVNNHAHVLKPKECLDVDYLCDSIKFYDVSTIVNGATRQKLTQSAMVEMKIFLPPLETQKQIAKQLNKCTTLLAKHKQMLETYDTLIKSRFIEMFGDPVINEKDWDLKTLPELGEFGRGVSKHRPRNAPELLGGKYPLIQTGDVANANLYITDYESTYSEEGFKQSKMWKAGTLCITIAATIAATIAKTAILTFDSCFPDSVVGFTPNEKTNSLFINYWFSFFQKILEEQAPAVAQKNINLQVLSELKIITPPISLQNNFAAFVQQIDKSKFEIANRLKRLYNKGMLS